MKGIVFNLLQQFVEEQAGLVAWDKALTQCELPSEGIYVSTVNYDDAELESLVRFFSEHLAIPTPELVRAFGRYVFSYLLEMAPEKAKKAEDLRAFLLMVHNIIHAEVKKLYQDSNLPDFSYQNQGKTLSMLYRSPRKLCHFSEGLIMGAAAYFREDISISQSQCMHLGADHCTIEVQFND